MAWGIFYVMVGLKRGWRRGRLHQQRISPSGWFGRGVYIQERCSWLRKGLVLQTNKKEWHLRMKAITS